MDSQASNEQPNVPTAIAASSVAWAELLNLADTEQDHHDDRAATLVDVLQRDGDRKFVDLALPLLADPNPGRRQMAAWLLGQFGYPAGRPYGDRIAPALASAARSETDDITRNELVAALGFAEDPTWAGELARYSTDAYAPVRLTVAQSMPSMFAGDDLDPAAIATMLTLTRDEDPDVRDWATFGLGSQSDVDNPVLREALAARLDDDGADTAFEATLGLARRGDNRIRERLVQRLSMEDSPVYLLDLEAAAALADPALMPYLQRLREEWVDDDEDDAHVTALRVALDSCGPRHDRTGIEERHQLE